MAKIVLTNAQILVNDVDLSDHANSVTLTYEVDSVETTSFGDGGHRFTGGLQNVSVEIAFMQDFAAANVEATIYPLVGTTTAISLKPVKGVATSATNPGYSITNAFLASHTPIAATVGELAMTTLTFTGGTLTKSTT